MNELPGVRGAGDLSTAVQAFIGAVGERVRRARQECGMSRRELSELSGVSLRYLAHLESGSGNISIALLYKVADALGRDVGVFVGEPDDHSAETAELVRLYRSADAGQRQGVVALLNASRDPSERKRRVAVIGVRGAGKSTLGRRVGEALSIPFAELNSDVEEQSGMPVEEVMALYGQEGFRALERQALERIVSTTDEIIVAVAGGIVSEPEGYDFLLRNFHTVWLKTTPEEHMNRVRAQGDSRPMAGNPRAMEELQAILTSRELLYAKAESTVDTSGKSVEESVHDVIAVIGESA